MAKASINFQKGSVHSDVHNFRNAKQEPEYLLPKEHRLENEYWRHEKTAEQIFQDEFSKAIRRGGAIPKFENSYWEGVLNLNKEHALEDVKKVAEHIESKFNIICNSIVIHKDEGRLAEDKVTPIYNLHAHLTFVTYKDSKQNWRLTHTKNKLPGLQTEIAEILGMQRGKEGSGAVRLEHREYKAVKQAEQKVLLRSAQETAQLKTEFELFRKKMINAGTFASEHYKELGDLKKEIISDRKIGIKDALATLEKLKEQMSDIREQNLTGKIIEASKKKTVLSEKIDEKLLKSNIDTVITGVQDLANENENALNRMMRGLSTLFRHAKYIIKKQKQTIDFLRSTIKRQNEKIKELENKLSKKVDDWFVKKTEEKPSMGNGTENGADKKTGRGMETDFIHRK